MGAGKPRNGRQPVKRWVVVVVVMVVLFSPAILALTWPRRPSEGTPVDDATETGVPVGIAMVVDLPRVFGA
jgi:hypothetical protein